VPNRALGFGRRKFSFRGKGANRACGIRKEDGNIGGWEGFLKGPIGCSGVFIGSLLAENGGGGHRSRRNGGGFGRKLEKSPAMLFFPKV